MRLDAFFVNNLKFAGGLLVDVQRGNRVMFEQTYVNNEVWLPPTKRSALTCGSFW